MSEDNFSTVQIGTTYTLQLPPVTREYRQQHVSDNPVMIYPGEIVVEHVDDKGNRYMVTNYCRIYSYKKRELVKSCASIYMPTFLKRHFTPEQLDNEYTRNNLQIIGPSKYYQRNKEARLAYQRKYREENIEKVREIEKKYRMTHKEQLNERQRKIRAVKRANMTEEEREANNAKRREQYRIRKAKKLAEEENEMKPAQSNEEEEKEMKPEKHDKEYSDNDDAEYNEEEDEE